MASAPQALPLFYNALEPLSSETHANFRFAAGDSAPFLVNQHAIPVTVDEFVAAQPWLPIVFTTGADSIPIALMGLNEGVNVFVGDDGKLIEDKVYVPAYIRRYPFMLARLRPDAQELSLCFDPTSETIGAFEQGEPLFAEGKPTELVQNILGFNEQFEQAGARTANFMTELRELDLLMDGEFTLNMAGNDQPFVYRGFQIVNEEKLNDLRGDQLRKIQKSGLLPLVYAHLFSLTTLPQIFDRQVKLGKVPAPQLIN
ncbi:MULTISPECIES: SapC family protein [unclassified Sphingomonas]|uniref:SapC family protein n=1 Tax=unclassified Sphingomonas TaxID=196159 RepID=UPI000314762E|nr:MULTISPECIES: SapC family protein [unclassified Sphingomonas]